MAFSVYYGGGESPVLLDLLVSEGIDTVMVSYYEWVYRYGTATPLDAILPPNVKVYLTTGVDKPKAKMPMKRRPVEWTELVQGYITFVQENIERLAYAQELGAASASLAHRLYVREAMLPLQDRFVAVPGATSIAGLEGEYTVGLTRESAKRFDHPLGKPVHAINTTSARFILRIGAGSVSTHAWLSPKRFGQFWIYDQTMHRFPHTESATMQKHEDSILEMGIDPMEIYKGDRDAAQLLALRSFVAWSADLAHKAETEPVGHEAQTTPSEGATPVVIRSDGRERTTLPVLLPESIGQRGIPSFSGALLRTCDSCYLSTTCPGFTPHASCVYEIPVTITDRDAWRQACQSIIEMQYQRVAFGYWAEQAGGTTMTQTLGPEMDRFFKLLRELKGLEQVEEKATTQGVLTEIFGALLNKPSAAIEGPTDATTQTTSDEEDDEEDDDGEGEDVGGDWEEDAAY